MGEEEERREGEDKSPAPRPLRAPPASAAGAAKMKKAASVRPQMPTSAADCIINGAGVSA